jgi:hypothetical protein
LKSANLYHRFNLVLGFTLLIVISLANARSLVRLLAALLARTTHNGRMLLPLTVRMKLLMMFEATLSLLTLALVAARAVNILR